MKILIEEVNRALAIRFPIIERIRSYHKKDVVPDFVAGITVGLMLIPQSIAYASLAGLDPQYGLYSSLSGGLAYAVFGTVKQITIGPSAILSLMTNYYAGEDNPAAVAILTLCSGLIQVIFGIFRLGFIIDFVSMPVISGYTSAAALIVATSQIKGLLGIKVESDSFPGMIENIAIHLGEAKLYDSVLGIMCLIFLIGIKLLKEHYFKGSKLFFYISTAKNAIVVLCSTILAYLFFREGKRPFTLTGEIRAGLPKLKIPSFSYVNNGEEYDFMDIIKDLGFGVISLAVVAISSHIVVAKIFTRGTRLKASQEIIALGATNVIGSFVGAMPVCASFSRSAINNASNVKTPFGGIYTVILVLLALLVLTPYFYFIPTASLSAVVISAVIFMVETDMLIATWNCSRRDLIPTLATFIVSLFFGIEKGLICGIGIDFAIILYYTSRPNISFDSTEVNQQLYWIITPMKGLLFPSSAYLQKKVMFQAQNYKKSEIAIVVFNLIHVAQTDYTTGQVLKDVIIDLKKNFKDCIILNGNKTVVNQLQLLVPNMLCVNSLEHIPKQISVISLDPMRKRSSIISPEPVQKQIPTEHFDVKEV